MMAKVRDVVVIDLREKQAFTDFLVIGTAVSSRHIHAVAYALRHYVRQKLGEAIGN